jgi:ABC-2 type transport system permease protein
MKAILFREIKSFFGSPIGYLVIAIFLLMNGLFLWIFPGNYNILDSGFANLNPFFNFSPWILIFLIPAVTMKSFSEEKKQGTLELLLTKPIGLWKIVLGKFFAAVLLIIIAIIPTYIYVYILSDLTLPNNQLDFGAIIGSYFGLIFLIFAYTSIGIFTSTLSENQIVAFILAIFFCFLFYFGFEALAGISKDFSNQIAFLGMENHFKSIGRGVIDSRDVVYFLSISFFFLYITTNKLKSIQ